MHKKDKLISIISVCIFFFVVFVLFGSVSYEGNDDVLMNLLTAGALGESTPFLVYTDYLIGLVICCLYHILPFVNCYLWFYLILNFVSISVLSLIFSDKLSVMKSLIVTIAINCLLSYEFYNYLQYTKNAMLYTVTGMVVLLWLMFERKDINWPITIGGSFLIMLGFSIRREAFLLSIPVGISIFLILMAFDRIKGDKKRTSTLAIMMVTPCLLCLLSFANDYFFCKSNPEWSEYYQIDRILSEKRDYYQYQYADSPDDYADAGLTDTDFEMLGSWIWNDPEQFTLQKLEKMAEIGDRFRTDKVEFYKEIVWEVGDKAGDSMLNKGIPVLFLVLFLISMTLDNKTRVINCCLLCTIALELFYIVCRGRFMWRAEICVWMPAIILSSYFCLLYLKNKYELETTDRSFFSRVSVCLQILAVLGCVFAWRFFQFYSNGYRITKDDTSGYELVQNINASDAFFVVQMDKLGSFLGAKNIFEIDCRYKGCYSNNTFLGSWLIPTPIAKDAYQKQGIENPIKNLLDDNVYCIANEERVDLLHRFLEEKYHINVTESQVTLDGVTAWKFSTDER